MSKRGIFILALILITLLTWFGFDLYYRRQETKSPQVSEEILAPLTPQLNTELLDKLGKRQNSTLPAPLEY